MPMSKISIISILFLYNKIEDGDVKVRQADRALLWVHHPALARPQSAIFWSNSRNFGLKFSRPRIHEPDQWRFEFRDAALHFVSF